tara:strand:- start:3150 stop:3818 length:669 start_codon:yes stop_codon:yes gene_type:complete
MRVLISELILRQSGLSPSMRTRKLAMLLSSLEQTQFKSAELEQYSTHGDLAARWLLDIHSFGDMQEGCKVVDLGAGNGVMGLGSLSLGASEATLVEADQMALKIAQINAKQMGFTDSVRIIQSTLGTDSLDIGSADLIISNPPWGRQSPKADRPFLDAILSSQIISHIMHSAEASHIEPLFEGQGWSVERYGEADFALPAEFSYHSRRRGKTRAAFWRLTPP